MAWVRIFSRTHSPKTTEGYYLVYLFSGDGAEVYLSLTREPASFEPETCVQFLTNA
ncbi:DUF3578 domain-containing protein [Nocardia iowensis]|uniref:DUF3578 domain-containing protein n=1 Tax=Nocardia iowensis TaxID=204891 RepID=A0ABX8RY11_NOCIO|nr:DUF3578 domain-containing protein [Nocardia iowensis]